MIWLSTLQRVYTKIHCLIQMEFKIHQNYRALDPEWQSWHRCFPISINKENLSLKKNSSGQYFDVGCFCTVDINQNFFIFKHTGCKFTRRTGKWKLINVTNEIRDRMIWQFMVWALYAHCTIISFVMRSAIINDDHNQKQLIW